MKKVLLDTNILIDYLRAKRGPIVELFQLQEKGHIQLYLSSLTVMELYAGLSSSKMQDELDAVFNACFMIPFDQVIARFAGELKRNKKFQAVPLADFLIGTTALWLKAQLATGNQKHFAGIPGLKFFDLPKKM